MSESSWQPQASLDRLRQRAALYRQLRDFFAQREVCEVEVPVLARAAVSDPHIDSICATAGGESLYLQTSPEFFMKRLLAAGSGDIYSLGKAFRNGEVGKRHNPEFTMLEWYRLGWDEHRLMDEVAQLIGCCARLPALEKLSYRELFVRHLDIDPHTASVPSLRALALKHCDIEWDDDDRDVWLDLLMTHVIEPHMIEGLTLIFDFPASQAALARCGLDHQGQTVARRFEAYVNGVELANGYWELCDASEQARRLEADLEKRQRMKLPQYPVDQHLLEALESGLPECAGVALGVDRLMMLSSGEKDIRALLAFPFERV